MGPGSKGQNGDTLLLATGKLRRIMVRSIQKSYTVQKFLRALFGFSLSHEPQFHRSKHDILERSHVLEQVELLKHHAHALANVRFPHALCQNALAIQQDVATRRNFEQVQLAQESRLAATRRSDNRNHVAAVNVKRNSLENLLVAVRFAKVLDLD